MEQMRRGIIKYLENNNVRVVLHVIWTPTALQLTMNAERVVNLFLEPAFARISYNLARMALLPFTTGPSGTVGKVDPVANQ